jgi:hypothetical protein
MIHSFRGLHTGAIIIIKLLLSNVNLFGARMRVQRARGHRCFSKTTHDLDSDSLRKVPVVMGFEFMVVEGNRR